MLEADEVVFPAIVLPLADEVAFLAADEVDFFAEGVPLAAGFVTAEAFVV